MKQSIQEQRRDLELIVRRALVCPRCSGTGALSDEPRSTSTQDRCGLCHGSGLYADERAVSRLVEALLGDVADNDWSNIANRPT